MPGTIIEGGVGAGAVVREILRDRLERFWHRRRDLDGGSPDEAVHQVRVSARRLQTALRICRPLCELPAAITPVALRRVEHRFGALRDLDVLTARLGSEPAPASAKDRTVLADLRNALAAEHVAAERKASSAVDGRRLSRLLDSLADWIEAPGFTPVAGLPMRVVAPDLLLPTLGRALLHPGWQIGDLPSPHLSSAHPLHALRRRLKALRYAVECFADWYGEPVARWLNELHAMQDALGAWHDEGLLLVRLERLGGSEALRDTARTRSREALASWPAWRGRYLDPDVRACLRRLLEGGAPAAGALEPGEMAFHNPIRTGTPDWVGGKLRSGLVCE